jgi:hypothetical protein
LTHFVPAETTLVDHPRLYDAVLYWYSNIEVRKPICISCRLSFLDPDVRVGAFLLSTPVSVPDIVVTSGFCAECHETLSMGEIEAVSTRVLRQLAPGGHFSTRGDDEAGSHRRPDERGAGRCQGQAFKRDFAEDR